MRRREPRFILFGSASPLCPFPRFVCVRCDSFFAFSAIKYSRSMMYSRCMGLSRVISLFTIVAFASLALAQNLAPQPADDYSGMYAFLKEGEFVQITIEEKGSVSGFISRYGDSPSDKGTFLDQFFRSGKIDGKNITFTTESVHGTWYSFDGFLDRGTAGKPSDEGYYILRGTLTRSSTDAGKKTTSQQRQVEFKSFPRDVSPPH
jgi:hypothetical protein